jgi:hypothetical protein
MIIIIIISLITGFLSLVILLLNQRCDNYKGFKFQIVALPVLCAAFLVQLFFAQKLLNAFLVLFPDIFSPFVTIPVAPMTTGMMKHFIFRIH